MLGMLTKGLKAVATGNTQSQLGLQSPHLPGAVTRLGRFGMITSGVWIGACWYSGYVNSRTTPGSGPTLVIPGTKPKISAVDRANPNPDWASATSQVGGGVGGVGAVVTAGTGGGRSPWPGASGSRLDQGFDFTSRFFNAPADMQIVYATNSDPGWRGGGMIAGRILSGPKAGKVMYLAEGIRPAARVGDIVKQGGTLATPVSNPYNGIVGNVEAGWANPASPGQPLAQVSANPPSVAWDFYNWQLSLGGPRASNTGNAGYP